MNEKTIAVTGISGFFGRALLPYLEQDANIKRVIGIDRQPMDSQAAESGSKLRFHQLDIRDPNVEEALSGVDTLVHLAFILMRSPGDSEKEIDAINVGGTRAICEAAARQGVRKFIFTSSVVAYGLHADNPIPLTEQSPLRPNTDLYYSRNKAAVEGYLDAFSIEHPEMLITRLRPCTVVGSKADPDQMSRLTGSPTIMVQGADPPYQLLHEDDMARALHLVIERDAPGIYNATSDEPSTLRQMASSGPDGRIIELPYFLVRGLMWLMWQTGQSAFAPEWADLNRYSLVASNDKLKGLGWQPRYTTAQAYDELLANLPQGK